MNLLVSNVPHFRHEVDEGVASTFIAALPGIDLYVVVDEDGYRPAVRIGNHPDDMASFAGGNREGFGVWVASMCEDVGVNTICADDAGRRFIATLVNGLVR
jgi:hypothetical protein